MLEIYDYVGAILKYKKGKLNYHNDTIVKNYSEIIWEDNFLGLYISENINRFHFMYNDKLCSFNLNNLYIQNKKVFVENLSKGIVITTTNCVILGTSGKNITVGESCVVVQST